MVSFVLNGCSSTSGFVHNFFSLMPQLHSSWELSVSKQGEKYFLLLVWMGKNVICASSVEIWLGLGLLACFITNFQG